MLLLGDRGTVNGVVDVPVGDRLALDANLLALDRDGRLDLLGDDVLAQARAAALLRRVPTASSSSERVIASSVVGPRRPRRPARARSWPWVPGE